MRPAIVAVLIAVATVPALPATAAPPAAAASPAALKLAERLEAVAEPHAALVATNYAAWEATLRRTLSLEPNVAKLEATYPGVTEAAVEAARPAGRAYCDTFVTRAAALRAQVYAGALTEAELRQVIAFLETPAAQRVIHRMLANTSGTALVDQVARQAVSEGKVTITADQARQLNQEAATRTVREISADDQVAFLRFNQSEAGKKYITARATSEQLILDMINHQDPAEAQAQQRAMQAAILAYIDRKKAR